MTSASIDMASFIDLILISFGLAVISTMSSSLSSSSEFWEVDADRVEKNSSSQLALSSLYVDSVEVASKASTAEGVSDFRHGTGIAQQRIHLHEFAGI